MWHLHYPQYSSTSEITVESYELVSCLLVGRITLMVSVFEILMRKVTRHKSYQRTVQLQYILFPELQGPSHNTTGWLYKCHRGSFTFISNSIYYSSLYLIFSLLFLDHNPPRLSHFLLSFPLLPPLQPQWRFFFIKEVNSWGEVEAMREIRRKMTVMCTALLWAASSSFVMEMLQACTHAHTQKQQVVQHQTTLNILLMLKDARGTLFSLHWMQMTAPPSLVFSFCTIARWSHLMCTATASTKVLASAAYLNPFVEDKREYCEDWGEKNSWL